MSWLDDVGSIAKTLAPAVGGIVGGQIGQDIGFYGTTIGGILSPSKGGNVKTQQTGPMPTPPVQVGSPWIMPVMIGAAVVLLIIVLKK